MQRDKNWRKWSVLNFWYVAVCHMEDVNFLQVGGKNRTVWEI